MTFLALTLMEIALYFLPPFVYTRNPSNNMFTIESSK